MEKTRFYVGEKGKDPLVDHNQAQPGGLTQEAMRVEFWIAKQIGTDLVKCYPNREWHVDVDSRWGVIVISCPSLSKRMGYRIHIRRDTIAELLPRCRKAAGEILERFGVSRSRIIDPYTFEAMPRDIRDDVVAPDATEKDAVEKFNRA